jgi:hypothetical protein
MPMDGSTFEQLKRISRYARVDGGESIGRDLLIRFLDTYVSGDELEVVDALVARYGLYPYLSGGRTYNVDEALALEFHSPEALRAEGFTFHEMQQRVYEKLMDGENVVLSAPTSFGKSVVIDALIASNKWSQIVILVPTLALIDETRRRVARFSSDYKVVTHPSQELGPRNVLVMTQERFLELDTLPEVDLFVIDEFYKLGSGDDRRRTLLNVAWRRLHETGAQYYMIGPNVDALAPDVGAELDEALLVTDFKTVSVDVEDRSEVVQQLADLLELVPTLEGASLVFTGSPAKAERLAADLAGVVVTPERMGFSSLVSQWMAENYDAGWSIPSSLARGVGVHSGPMPRSLQRIMIRLFNELDLSVLVCTSTLIEGVNTSAKNVIVFEKKIDGQLLDFFTFSNIRGRAGRMFRHYVGKVFTYSAPPDPTQTEVDIPIESQSETASLSTLIQLADDDLTDDSRERLRDIYAQSDLSLSTIKKNRGLNPERQIAVAIKLRNLSRAQASGLGWTGAPTNDQARAVLRIAFEDLLEPRQRRGMNFEMLWGKLQNVRSNRDDFSAMVDQQMIYARPGQTRTDIVEDVMRFQRNWMGFTIPSMIRGLQSIQKEIFSERDYPSGNYEFMLREIESQYLPNDFLELEEYGVPVPLALKLTSHGLNGTTVSELLDSLAVLMSDSRIVSQLTVVERWILEDVMVGLVGRGWSSGATSV